MKGKKHVYIQIFYVKASNFKEASTKRGRLISCTEVSENPQITELVSAIGAEHNRAPWTDEEVIPPEMGFKKRR